MPHEAGNGYRLQKRKGGMHMVEFEEYKTKLNGLKPELLNLFEALKMKEAEAEIARLEEESAADGFWADLESSQKVLQTVKKLKSKVAVYNKLKSKWDDLYTLCTMAIEENDDSMLPELVADYAIFEEELETARLSTLLKGEYDSRNAIMSFHAGAGGTEAQDWAQMLYRMYTRWAERHGYKYKLLDWLDGDEAGIKSATILISVKTRTAT
jgi:peptide chain release factor 2